MHAESLSHLELHHVRFESVHKNMLVSGIHGSVGERA